jgi:hypothetical protein
MRCWSHSGRGGPRVLFYPEAGETGWSGLGNQTVRFGSHRELVPTSALVSAFASGTLSYFVADSPGPFSALGSALSLAKASVLGPVFPWLLSG